MTKIIHFLIYCVFCIFGFFISFLPYSVIHAFGRLSGRGIFYLHRSFRKKTLSNLAIAYGEKLSEKQRHKIAIESFQNLTITCLEYFRLMRSKHSFSNLVKIDPSHEVFTLLKQGQGVIFLSGHQANWEIPFIAATKIHRGIAIGRPIKNPWLYRWILAIRQMHGGVIVMPRNAIRQSLQALKEGKFVGIVGDQAFPESPYAYPLFGTRAWTTPMPALLAYRTNSPIMVVMTERKKGHYELTGSPLLWPNMSAPKEEEIPRLMDTAMSYLEKSIQEHPGQWMWQHDRWKQQGIDKVKREYRFGFILVTLPKDPSPILPHLALLRAIYPRCFLTFFAPEGTSIPLTDCEVNYYKEEKDLLVRDWRFQFVLDFYDSAKARRHFLSLGAFKALNLEKMRRISGEKENISTILQKTLVKPQCLPIVTT